MAIYKRRFEQGNPNDLPQIEAWENDDGEACLMQGCHGGEGVDYIVADRATFIRICRHLGVTKEELEGTE